MSTVQSIRIFLSQYSDGDITVGRKSRPTEGDQPPADVNNWFTQSMGNSDQHVIPLNRFEFRVRGEDQQHEQNSRVVRYSDIVGTVEYAWDNIVADYGLDAVSAYVPFHKDPATYGIYIRQQGIRFLGHLLYQWSRVSGLADTPSKYGDLLQQYDFQSSNRLHFEEPAFASVEDAFNLAQEMILRYQWFRHQIELLASYLEDATGSRCYESYWGQMQAGINSVESILSTAYVARSFACRSKAPVLGLYRPLFNRMMVASPSSDQVAYASSGDGFDELCGELVAEVVGQSSRAASGPPPRGVSLAEQLPFKTDIWSAVPSRVPVYVTRNEFSTDNGSYGPREKPLDPDWEIETADSWDESYRRADGSLKQRADNTVTKLEQNVRHSGFRWKACKPDNQWYFRLNQQFRGIAEVYNRDFKIVLVDFGAHSVPSDYGCWS